MQTQRRHLAAALVGFPALLALPARATGRLRPTPVQTEGPFYPVRIPDDADNDLLRNGTLRYGHGQPAWLRGVVRDTSGRPLRGAQVEIWQCDEAGHYDHPGDGNRSHPAFQGFGRMVAQADGSWAFRTIRPVNYPGRTPHIHAKVRLDGRTLLTTQLYVEGDPGNARDGIWRRMDPADRALVTLPFVPVADGLQARCTLTVAV